jgi:hypothetical protein
MITLIAEALYRRARKEWGCQCPGNGHHNCPHVLCQQTIKPGDEYVEYIGEASAYQSGKRYCLPCGVESWSVDDCRHLPEALTVRGWRYQIEDRSYFVYPGDLTDEWTGLWHDSKDGQLIVAHHLDDVLVEFPLIVAAKFRQVIDQYAGAGAR